MKNCKTLNPFISRISFRAAIHFCIQLHAHFAPFTLSLSGGLVPPLFLLCMLFSAPFAFIFFFCSLCHHISRHFYLSLYAPAVAEQLRAEGFTGDQLSIELSQLCPL